MHPICDQITKKNTSNTNFENSELLFLQKLLPSTCSLNLMHGEISEFYGFGHQVIIGGIGWLLNKNLVTFAHMCM